MNVYFDKFDYKCRTNQSGLQIFYILVQMLSTSKLGSYSLTQSKTNEKLFKKLRFSSHMVSPLEQYKQQLCGYVSELKKKYPNVDVDYIRSLLQELDNNIEMVQDILEEEHKRQIKNSMEQQRSESQSILYDSRKQKIEMPKTQDVKVLQKSVVKLFKKFAEEKREKEQLLRKLAILAKQNENLKLMNRQLMSEQMQPASVLNTPDIY